MEKNKHGDPIGIIQPLLTLINQISTDIFEVDKWIGNKKIEWGSSGSEEENDNLYKEEITVTDSDIALLETLR